MSDKEARTGLGPYALVEDAAAKVFAAPRCSKAPMTMKPDRGTGGLGRNPQEAVAPRAL